MKIETHWKTVKKVFTKSFSSSFHFSIASIGENGNPHITPIGSLILGSPGNAIYFEEFTSQLPKNIIVNNHLCILAVNSGKWFWLKSLIKGKFSEPPSLRLHGEAGVLRDATEVEVKLWHKRVKTVSFTKGHKLMWRRMSKVREVKITKIDPVHIGSMTNEINIA